MNKKLLVAILAVIVLLLSCAMYIYYDATFLAQYDYKVSYLSVSHPDTRDHNFRILYLTDLEYGTYTDETHLQAINETLNALDYDLVIFGGDLFDRDYTPQGNDITVLTSFLTGIKAPEGKFAIFGDYDLISDSRKNITAKILRESGFEIIADSVKVHLSASHYFRICGYEPDAEVKNPNMDEHLDIAVIHSLNQRSQLSEADLILCGNSHAMQINLPFSGRYKLGWHEKDRLYYSSGLGMTKTAHRLFCDPEVVIITLN